MATPHEIGCKVCGETNKRLRRGLCSMHYGRYLARLKKLSAAEAEAFEQKCINDGWLEESRQGQRETDPDPFEQLVAEVRAEFKTDVERNVNTETAKGTNEETTPKRKAE